MENKSISEDIGSIERLNKLEKAFHRASNFFAVTSGFTILPWMALAHCNSFNEKYYVGAALASLPVVFTAWLNSMSYKTEEYAQLRDKYQRDLI